MAANPISRRDFLRLGGASAAALAVSASRLEGADLSGTRPNIILIVTDDMSFTTLRCYAQAGMGSFYPGDTADLPYTPRIDAMAAEGIRFDRAYAASSVCAPARYSILTGRYPSACTSDHFLSFYPEGEQVRLFNNVIALEDDGMNLPSILQANGYVTGMVGKWHLGEHIGTASGPTWAEAGLLTYDQASDPMTNAVTSANMYSNHSTISGMIKNLGFDYANGVYDANLKELENDPSNIHNLDWTLDAALDFIDTNQSNSFFLYFCPTLMHGPDPWVDINNTAMQNDDHKYTGAGYDSNFNRVIPDYDAVTNDIITNTGYGASVARTKASFRWLDMGVGEILDKVQSLGLDDNTLFIFTSDHQHEDGKETLYEGGLHVPFIARWHNSISPGICDELVHHTDLVPTLLELCGISRPSSFSVNGKSVRPILEGALNAKIHNFCFSEVGWTRAVYTKDNKYITIRHPEDIQSKIDKGFIWTYLYDGTEYYIPEPLYSPNQSLGHLALLANDNYFGHDQLYNTALPETLANDLSQSDSALLALMQGYMRQASLAIPDRPYGNFCKELPDPDEAEEIKEGDFRLSQSLVNRSEIDKGITIHYNASFGKEIIFDISNLNGDTLRSLEGGYYVEGQVIWDGKSSGEKLVEKGIYLVTMRSDGEKQSTKVLVVR